MRFNIVIATHQRAELLERTLQSLATMRRPPGFERIVVIENGAASGAAALCERFGTILPVKYRYHPEPGKGRSIQWAIEQLGEGFALFLDTMYEFVKISSRDTLLPSSSMVEVISLAAL